MKVEIDISGQIQQLNYDSALGCKGDGIERSVFLRSETKKEVIKKYKGQVTNLIEKLHCIMIYYCIKDFVNEIDTMKICTDVNFRRLGNLLPFLFKDENYLKGIRIKRRKGNEKDSKAHRVALRAFRKRKFADLLITKEMIEEALFEFKEK